jgi:hypothetical protein
MRHHTRPRPSAGGPRGTPSVGTRQPTARPAARAPGTAATTARRRVAMAAGLEKGPLSLLEWSNKLLPQVTLSDRSCGVPAAGCVCRLRRRATLRRLTAPRVMLLCRCANAPTCLQGALVSGEEACCRRACAPCVCPRVLLHRRRRCCPRTNTRLVHAPSPPLHPQAPSRAGTWPGRPW